MTDRVTMNVAMQVTPAQGVALQAMFDYWAACGRVGSSRKVTFYVDGDGDFKPDCQVTFNDPAGIFPILSGQLREETAAKAVVEDHDGDRVYDADGVAWLLR